MIGTYFDTAKRAARTDIPSRTDAVMPETLITVINKKNAVPSNHLLAERKNSDVLPSLSVDTESITSNVNAISSAGNATNVTIPVMPLPSAATVGV